MKRDILALGIASIWITASEFVRDEFLFKIYWIAHFEVLGLIFQTLLINGLIWIPRSISLAYLSYSSLCLSLL